MAITRRVLALVPTYWQPPWTRVRAALPKTYSQHFFITGMQRKQVEKQLKEVLDGDDNLWSEMVQ